LPRSRSAGEYVPVQTAGAASWRLNVRDSDVAELALFVRDAVGLPVSASPPLLDGPVADQRDALADRDRTQAAAQWVPWWHRILTFEFGIDRLPERARAGGAEFMTALQAISDPPEFTSLADAPQLRAAVRATFDDAMHWQRGRRTAASEPPFGWPVTKQAVDDVAFDRQVPVDTLSGVLLVLPVAGRWWQRFGPGQVVCSAAAVNDYNVAYEVFASSLET
jgi:hypothetical protein